MILAETQPTQMRLLLKELDSENRVNHRIRLIDQLVSYFVFTNLEKTRCLLDEQAEIQGEESLSVSYYIHRALLENQAYRYDLAEELFQKAISLLEEKGDTSTQAELFIDYAGTCINTRRMEDAATLLEKARRILRLYPDEQLRARIICREGFIQLHYSNYSRAIELLLEADKLITEQPAEQLQIKDYYFLVLIYSGLGNIHERNDDLEQSIRAYKRAAQIAEKFEMWSRMSWIYMNIGNGYMSLENYGPAARFFTKAIKLDQDVHPVPKASAYANLGYCRIVKKKYDKALQLLDKAEEIFDEAEDAAFKNYALIESWRGLVFARLGDVRQAETYFFKAIKWARLEDDYKRLSGIFQNMAEFYADQGDFQRAYKYQLMHSTSAVRYNEEVNQRKRLELEFKYEAAQKQKEAEMLRLQATRLQLKALRAQMNPHFIFNALNSIQHYITSYQTDSASRYLAMFARLMRQSLDYSDLEIISLDKELDFLRDYLLINQKLRFNNGLQFEIKVSDEIDEDMTGVPTMIVQPYVENAIEHGLRTKQEGTIRLSFDLFDENTLLCVVEDDGVGRENARKFQQTDASFQQHLSRGTSITEQRLRLLTNTKGNGIYVETIDLQDANGTPCGTRVELKIPIIDIPLFS